MIKLLLLLPLLTFSTPASATVNICQEIAAELYFAADDDTITLSPDQIKEIIERCEISVRE